MITVGGGTYRTVTGSVPGGILRLSYDAEGGGKDNSEKGETPPVSFRSQPLSPDGDFLRASSSEPHILFCPAPLGTCLS